MAYYVTLIIFIPLALVDTQTLGIAILQAKNKHKFRSIVYLCVAIACIITCIPFIKKYDVIGCALATSFALLLGNLFIMNWYYYKKINLNIFKFWKELFSMLPGILISTVIMYLLLKFVLPIIKSYRLLLPFILIYIIVFVIIMFFMSFNEYEKELVRNFIRRFRRRI